MKNKYKNIFTYLVVVIVFFVQLKRGLVPSGETSGAMNEPYVVVISAIMASVLTLIILKVLFWVYSRIKKK